MQAHSASVSKSQYLSLGAGGNNNVTQQQAFYKPHVLVW